MSLQHESFESDAAPHSYPELTLISRNLGAIGIEAPSECTERPIYKTIEEEILGAFMDDMRSWLSDHGKLRRHGALPKDDLHTFDYLTKIHEETALSNPYNPLSDQAPLRLGNALHTYKKHRPDAGYPRTGKDYRNVYERYQADAASFKAYGFKDVDRMAIKYDPILYTSLLQRYEGNDYVRPHDVRYVFKNLYAKPRTALREMINTMQYIEVVYIPRLQAESGYTHHLPRQLVRRLTWNADPLADTRQLFYDRKDAPQPRPRTETTNLHEELDITLGTTYGALLQEVVQTVQQDPDRPLPGLARIDHDAIEAVLCDHATSYKQQLAEALEVEDLDTYVIREVLPHCIYLQQRSKASD